MIGPGLLKLGRWLEITLATGPLALFLAGGGDFRSLLPLRFFVCHCQTVGDSELKFSTFKGHSLAKFCEIFGTRLGQVTRSGQLTLLQNSLQPLHDYSSPRISMKLTGLHEVISTYKMCVLEFLSW